ncbi:phosphoribosylformimino-5-aminoimidazole carboxamide ribotide isomerase [Paenibacillus radicis (ex Gao et al. 2016)]|uniref:1-(5-phosphoribosyl)-5-[(5-phosphoribosylamino) methylideneamino] imidazole-4-carboxamide isomerase n=1 Tax=Paenibacillus radicis (ex Gao et al. 2016) TaxID=1737354 RepID=A0A917HG91_9BACL|nr:phosphoribosylformimino-5-aminoimidazole carboxamide ribotide isomerase [Paenibacillus radicis (ex Gao et al. 2016)]GGG77873.1 1-(5-phosphoribosyl)-5-[(5-phosphoribosylamino) methylideneamino] imidazole-4-carboxamide isomerase [Paenibacillus radicis (ex Gao et al. 2016)]
MKFRPCIDLHSGKVKQIVGETLDENPQQVVENFVSEHDSAYYANMFKRDALTGGHVIMLGGGNEEAAIQALRAYPGGLQLGGGIKAENAAFYLEQGASQVIVTSSIFRDGELDWDSLRSIVSEVGKDRLVIDLSCKQRDGEWHVVTNQWRTFSSLVVNEANLRELESYCSEFLIHAVDVEGKRTGILESLVQQLAEWVHIPTTYAGGARSMEDLELFRRLSGGKLDITVGSALDIFGGNLSYDQVVAYSASIQ